jgi:hypothetical protein
MVGKSGIFLGGAKASDTKIFPDGGKIFPGRVPPGPDWVQDGTGRWILPDECDHPIEFIKPGHHADQPNHCTKCGQDL